MSLSSLDRASISSKRSLTPFPDLEIFLADHVSFDSPTISGYFLNYVAPEELLPSDVVVPHSLPLSFQWAGCSYSLTKVTSFRKFCVDSSDPEPGWVSHFIAYLASVDFSIPLASEDPDFEPAKRTCRPASPVPVSSEVPTSNSFAVLSPAPDLPSPASPAVASASPKMTFRSRIPPLSIKLTSDSTLSLVQSLLSPETCMVHLRDRIRIQASSLEEYKALLSLAAHHHMEFFTHNPAANSVAKSVLRGLPSTTASDVITSALSDLQLPVSHIRQMWRTTVSPAGLRSKDFLPLWVLTHSPALKKSLSALTGLLHFRVRIEDLKSTDRVFQCFRCQEFGHTANFCKFAVRCNLSAGPHESRQCTSTDSTPRRCSNCSGAHPASSRDCPRRLSYAASLRRRLPSAVSSSPLPSAFPPLPSRPVPSRPLPSPSTVSSLTDLLSLLSSPTALDAVSLLASLLRTLVSSPQLVSNLRVLLSALTPA